ncbi:hypothetical protein TCAL_16352 [Tigriopus californicus]|uniref:Uncharacterized protein n=1 Tax=Tigriopus californicus TaxID=6832 RepID=A0A553NZ46_TIGCA|nr:hypothetical protein TCAL_16352 [Tigriopus californicus]
MRFCVRSLVRWLSNWSNWSKWSNKCLAGRKGRQPITWQKTRTGRWKPWIPRSCRFPWRPEDQLRALPFGLWTFLSPHLPWGNGGPDGWIRGEEDDDESVEDDGPVDDDDDGYGTEEEDDEDMDGFGMPIGKSGAGGTRRCGKSLNKVFTLQLIFTVSTCCSLIPGSGKMSSVKPTTTTLFDHMGLSLNCPSVMPTTQTVVPSHAMLSVSSKTSSVSWHPALKRPAQH